MKPLDRHYALLEAIYARAPVTRLYGTTLHVSAGRAVVTLPVDDRFFHAAGGLHGSAYFRALDDAAFFAANSVEPEFFVLTSSFRVDFLRPVASGELRAIGSLEHHGRTLLLARADLLDPDGRRVAVGVGRFARSRIRLTDLAPEMSQG